MKKIGRNEICPCGSGLKFKKCHGALESLDRMENAIAAAEEARKQQLAHDHQRARQQGLGRPIVSARLGDGYQLVAVRGRLFHSKNWKTFHDFLIDYLKDAMGGEWGNAELQKPLEARHPLLLWYHKMCEQQRPIIKEPGAVTKGVMKGAFAAYLNLAYDLYLLEHNAELQSKLIARMQHVEHFWGARYEASVAATLVRAGFSIEFEDEDDRKSSHCEYTAISQRSGRQFSVEVKRSESGRITRQLVRALKKHAAHPRIVFIDINSPGAKDGQFPPAYLQRAFDQLRRFEAVDPQAARLPPAYVFFTNAPWEHHLDETGIPRFSLADGFHLDDFKLDRAFPSLRAAIDSKAAHSDMHHLLDSMQKHASIPATFDGENPELAFSDTQPRFSIGSKLAVPNGDGSLIGTLTSGVVLEAEEASMCCVQKDDGTSVIVKVAMTEAEFAAWKTHPETFFGELSRNHSVKSPIEAYEFVLASYVQTPKEKLLDLLANASDWEALSKLDQPELARVFSERMASHMFSTAPAPQAPPLRSKWGQSRKNR
ncbi:YecA family protein [Variovorax sp. GB1P17]|uniref:YecA family protein n=1 Tax=Variovorax sp. GB1P17 TaxID=3443740 RepID=UPI003F47899A